MNAVQQLINQAEQRCKENGSRLTAKRKQALSLLLKSDKALSAYELVDIYRAEFSDTLPPMTMYRILDFLETEHLIHRLETANKFVACKHIDCNHEHDATQFLICSQCQKVEEVTIKPEIFASLNASVSEAGFSIAHPQLEMKCLCNTCEQQRN